MVRLFARPFAFVAVVLGALLGAFALPLVPADAQTTAALPFSLPSPGRPAVIDARVGLHPDMTRFVLEISEPVSFTISLAGDPYRVIVALPDLSWPEGARRAPGRGLIAGYRYDDGGARLVMDTDGPVRVKDAFLLPPRDGHQPRLVIDIERVGIADFARLASVPSRPPVSAPPLPASSLPLADPAPALLPVAAPIPPPPPPRAGRERPGPDKAVPEKPLPEKPLIVIDPGHGGVDPGAIGVGGIYEKDITLATAREVRRALESSGRYRVHLTRDKDVFIPLRERVAIARDLHADLFISLHANTINRSDMRGLSIYTLSDRASDHEADMIAAKENRADAIAGVNLTGENDLVASILIDLAQRDTMNHSKRFASLALDNLRRDVKVLPQKPNRQAGFAVLTAPDMPSALIEMGYISNPKDAALLTATAHQDRFAHALVKAIDTYFKVQVAGRRT